MTNLFHNARSGWKNDIKNSPWNLRDYWILECFRYYKLSFKLITDHNNTSPYLEPSTLMIHSNMQDLIDFVANASET